jgi:ABC-type nitrate/sulfonate/bicarbonate transport system permease component
MTFLKRVLLGLLHFWPVALIIVAWDLWVVINGYTATVAPRPWEVVTSVVANYHELVGPTAYTAGIAVAGLIGGSVIGALGAMVIWWSSLLSGVLTPSALILRSVPITAMIPIIARVVGYGDAAVLVSTALISFFPAFVLTLSGLNSVPESEKDLFSVFGAGRFQILMRLAVLRAVPNAMVALRITAPMAVLSAMLCEFLIGDSGLGAEFSRARSYSNMEQAWGTALIATVMSVLVFGASRVLERTVTRRVT